ncbi:MAG: hypothetical protein IIA87_01300 [Nanoarchaeota archaeon]|nr:hypothetical protein [Nanoarchaeota archaeon]
MRRLSLIGHIVWVGTPIVIVAGVAFGALASRGVFGSNGVKDVYHFQYQGRKAVIKCEDLRWFPIDRYYVSFDNGDKVMRGERGELITDDEKIINVWFGGYRVREKIEC